MTNPHSQQKTVPSMRRFISVVLSVFISILGTQITDFALGVWVYEKTQSATLYALIGFAIMTPQILIAPLQGILIDRFNHRNLMLVGHAGAGLGTLVLALLFWLDQLQPWHIITVAAVSSLFNGLLFGTLRACTIHLVTPDALPRAQGIVQGLFAFTQIMSPVMSAFMLGSFGLTAIFGADILSFTVAIIWLSFFTIERRAKTSEKHKVAATAGENLRLGWAYLVERQSLLVLLMISTTINGVMGMVIVLFTPLVLGISTVENLGLLATTGGFGMLVASLALLRWGRNQHMVRLMLLFCVIGGCGLWVAVLKFNLGMLFVGAFVVMFSRAIIEGCAGAIWQRTVPANIQGRVFGIQHLISAAGFPLGYMAAGPLAEHLFEPAMATNGWLAPTIGQWLGTGPNRGIALLFCILGALMMLSALASWSSKPFREIERL